MDIPVGAVWFVLPYISPSMRRHWPDRVDDGTLPPEGLEARTVPTASTSTIWNTHNDSRSNPFLTIPHSTTIITGATLKDMDTFLYPYTEWVEVLFPTRCYVNRTHFNTGNDRMVRVG